MPLSIQKEFIRQKELPAKSIGLVVPQNAVPSPILPPHLLASLEKISPPSNPPNRFGFHYVDFPQNEGFFNDEERIDTKVYEFSVKDSILGVYDLQYWTDDDFSWSFATTDQYGIIAALKIGETFDIEMDVPFNQILHISKMKINLPGQGLQRNDYRYHVSIDKPINNKNFRITSAYEPDSPQTTSRAPFVFGFRIYGFIEEDTRPLWRKYLSDAVIYAQNSDWGFGLLNIAFSVESFIDMLIIHILSPLDLPQSYIDQLLQNGDRREELQLICRGKFSKARVNKINNKMNEKIFKLRNSIVHGRKKSSDISKNDYLEAIKTAAEFIWDFDPNSRCLLTTITHPFEYSSLLDNDFITACTK